MHVDYNRLVLSVCTCSIHSKWMDLINPDSDAIKPTMEADVGKTDNVI